jgi:hypothetical protein
VVSIQRLWISLSHAHNVLLLWELYNKTGKKKVLLLWVEPSCVAKWPSDDVQGDAGYQDVIECVNKLAEVCCFQGGKHLIFIGVFLQVWFVLTYQTKSLLLQLLQIRPEEVFIESTGVIGRRIKKVTWVTWCILYWLHWCAPCLLEYNELKSAAAYLFYQIINMLCCI